MDYTGTAIDGPQDGKFMGSDQPFIKYILPAELDTRMVLNNSYATRMHTVVYAWHPDKRWRLTEHGQQVWVKYSLREAARKKKEANQPQASGR